MNTSILVKAICTVVKVCVRPGVYCVVICFLVITSAFFVALPRTLALPAALQVHVSVTHTHGVTANGRCSYSPRAEIIVAYNHWNETAYFCNAGFLGTEVDNVNEIYNNGGANMWVRWYANPTGHYCALHKQGDYWNFSTPVKITQVDYGDDHSGSYCGRAGPA